MTENPSTKGATMNLFEMTPVQIDRELARINGEASPHFQRAHALRTSARKYERAGGNYAATAERKRAEADAATERGRDIMTAAEPFEAEYAKRGGWSRYFIVPAGHLHTSRSCHSLHPTTVIGWLPELSGTSREEAVASHGTVVCSHCIPEAPTFASYAKALKAERAAKAAADADLCPGSGKTAANLNFRYYQARGNCPCCGKGVTPTSTGMVRKHKVQS